MDKEVDFTEKEIIFIKDSFNNRKVSISRIAGYLDCSEEIIKKVITGNFDK